jgi:hypothetical protein
MSSPNLEDLDLGELLNERAELLDELSAVEAAITDAVDQVECDDDEE